MTVDAADYSKVNEAIAKADQLKEEEYKDFTAVEAAMGAVDYTKSFLEQATVDGYAEAIERAIAALEYKDADYSKVDAAVAKADQLKKDEYKDFTAVEAAVNGVVRGKNIKEQTVVDGYAEAIENAIAALEKKPDDTTDPTKPDDTTKPAETDPGSGTIPKTGDSSDLFLWMALMLVSCIGALGTVVYKKRITDR